MRSIAFEFVLKGVFLGLWAAAALRQSPSQPDIQVLLWHVLWTACGTAIGLAGSFIEQVVRGQKPLRNPVAFLITSLIEGSYWIYFGTVGGLAASLIAQQSINPILPEGGRNWLGYCVIAGAILGYGLMQLREVKNWAWRFGLAAAIGAGLVGVAILYLEKTGWLESDTARRTFGVFILGGLPFFYLLSFCGVAEESEVEIAALCAGLGVGIHLLKFPQNMPALGFVLPVMLYFVYITKWITGLRSFKHTLRGYSFLNASKIEDAFLSFRRARDANPKNALATHGLYDVHRQLKPEYFQKNPALADVLDFDFCLDRAQTLLISDRTPSDAERGEAKRMIDLVESYRPRLQPRIDYLTAILATFEKKYDEASTRLKRLLDPAHATDQRIRRRVLFPAWNLALRLHPEVVKRVGEAELAAPGRRMEAIATVERELARDENEPTANELKTTLYASLSEAEYLACKPGNGEFNHDYVEQLGLALIDNANPQQRDRGMAYLRMAARGLSNRGPAIFKTLAIAAEQAGDKEAVRGYREQIKRVGLDIGPKNLPTDQRAIYFETLNQLVSDAASRGDFESAAADQRLLVGSGPNELEQYRRLADFYEKAGDPLNALLTTETARLYSANDADLLARKDKYYFSVTPERLAGAKSKVEQLFDVNYCITKATSIVNQANADHDMLGWGDHLASLALVMQPASLPAKLAKGRLLLRLGDRSGGLTLLEDVREAKPSGDDKEAWFVASRILGELYLNELQRPDLAVHCFSDYKEHPKSGADTLFWIAKSYEANNDTKNAIRFYDAVTAYDQHPRYWEASEAIQRLKGSNVS